MVRRYFEFFGLVLAGGLLIGCGGGGGSGTIVISPPGALGSCSIAAPAGTLAYTTYWQSAPLTASEVVQILDSDGKVIRTDSVSRTTSSTSTLTLAGINAGVYEVQSKIYDQPNGAGNLLGVSRDVVNLCGTATLAKVANLSTAYGGTPQSVSLFPASFKVPQGQTYRLIPTAMGTGGTSAFVANGSFQFSTIGGIGTVSSSGVLTAGAPGSGSVQATLGSLFGRSSATVTANVITQSKWTVFVFMNAANDLYPDSDLNVDQMEKVANNPNLRFVVQWKQSRSTFNGSSFDGVRRYLVAYDTNAGVVTTPLQSNLVDGNGNALDMGSPQTLQDFLTWGTTQFPSARKALIIWNHGNGWLRSPNSLNPTRGFSYDDQYLSSINTWQIAQALGGFHFNFLAWDASLMQMIEVAYEAAPYADYIVGSEESPPAEGYPYDTAFAGLAANPDLSTSLATKAIVDATLADPAYVTRKITQSVIDTSKLPALVQAIDALGTNLVANASTLSLVTQNVRGASQTYSQTVTRYYRDLYDVCSRYEADPVTPASTKTACANVRAAITAAVVWEDHNSQSPNSHGISIDFSPGTTFSGLRSDYIQLRFSQASSWATWLGVAP